MMSANVEIIDRNGWKYARIPRPRGAGRALCHSLGTRSIEEARERVKAAELEPIALASRADALTREVWTRLLAGRKITVSESILTFRDHQNTMGGAHDSIERRTCVLDRLAREAGLSTQSISMIESRHVADFVNKPGPQTLSTRSWWLMAVKGWLDYCVGQRWLVVNPASEVAIRIDGLTQEQLLAVPHAAFEESEVKALLAKIPRSDFWHGAVLFGYYYGLRIGTVATLEDGNIIGNRLRIFTKKGRRVVNEYLEEEVIAWLDEWKAHREASDLPYVFPVQAGIYLSGSPLLSMRFKRLLEKHGMQNQRSFHCLRKTATQNKWNSELEQLGDKDRRALMGLVAKEGFRKVQELLGHAPSSSATERSYMART